MELQVVWGEWDYIRVLFQGSGLDGIEIGWVAENVIKIQVNIRAAQSTSRNFIYSVWGKENISLAF